MQLLLGTSISCGIDALLLGAFAVAGTVPAWVPVGYAAAMWLAAGALYAVSNRPSIAASRDPLLLVPNVIAASLIQLAAIALAPQLAFFFLTLLFIVFGIASLRLSTRRTLIGWLAICAAVGFTLYFVADVQWLPMSVSEDPGAPPSPRCRRPEFA